MKIMNDLIMNENDEWCKNGNELNDELIMNLECYVLSTGFFLISFINGLLMNSND